MIGSFLLLVVVGVMVLYRFQDRSDVAPLPFAAQPTAVQAVHSAAKSDAMPSLRLFDEIEQHVAVESPAAAKAQNTPVRQPQNVVSPDVKSQQQIQSGGVTIEAKKADIAQMLELRFRQQNDFASALALSREYYKRGEYEKALGWAVTANGIDSRVDESWMLFARACVKLNRKNDAINALESFNKHSATSDSRALLRQIRNGE